MHGAHHGVSMSNSSSSSPIAGHFTTGQPTTDRRLLFEYNGYIGTRNRENRQKCEKTYRNRLGTRMFSHCIPWCCTNGIVAHMSIHLDCS